jgi:hypothetical protein
MKLEDLLTEKRSAIIKKWRERIIESYPENTQRFLKKEKDQFSNPVGMVIKSETEILFDELTTEGDLGRASSSLDNLIRVRAIQDFKPSQAVAFVLQLKSIIREEMGKHALENGSLGELEALENRIDKAALLAFDIYTECRQKIYELRVNEVKNQVGRLLERANLVCEIPDTSPEH